MFEFRKTDPELVFLTSQHGMYTYSDLDRFTAFFQDILQQKAESLKWPVAFLSESSDMLIFSIAACWKLGVPFIPLNPKYSDDELKRQLKDLHPGLIFCDTRNRGRFTGDDVICMDENFFLNAFTFDIRTMKLPDEDSFDDDDVFGYFFTSGTSGFPKTVPLRRRQILVAAESSAGNFRPDPNHFWLLCLPLNHIGGISIILRSLIYGTAIYRLDVFHEEMIKEFLGENTRFQAASLVPTMLKRLLDDPLFSTHNSFKAILLGGGPTTASLLRKSVERGIPIVSSYGMTETCAQIIANPMLAPSGMYTPLNSVGKPFPPNELQIRDDNGKVLGRNQSGTIWLKGPQVFDGYFHCGDSKDRFDEDGWFNTGDYGHLNAFDQLFVESRRDDLIVSGGENISPQEVERVLENLPFVREAAVIGIPDEEWGQKVSAVISLKNGKTPELGEIRGLLRNKIIDYKIPKALRIVDELPKTTTGKIQRSGLGELFKDPAD